MASGDRRQRERQNRRMEVLQVALRLFSEFGYTSVTMDQIAESADLTKPTLYQYFKNKADLFSCIILELGFDHVEKSLLACVEKGQTPRQDIERIRDSFKELCLGAPRKVFLLYLGVSREEISSELDPATMKKMRTRLEQCLGIVEGAFARGIKERVFIPFDPADATQALWAMCIGLAQMKQSEALVSKGAGDPKKIYERVVGQFLESITK